MTKQPKDLKSLPSSSRSFGPSDEWGGVWKKIADENKAIIANYLHDTSIPASSYVDKKLFNPEEVTNVFTQTLKGLSEQAQSRDKPSNLHLLDVQSFLHSALKRFQMKTVSTAVRNHARSKKNRLAESDENPFFLLLQQSYLLNIQFLKEAASHIGEFDPQISLKLKSYTHHLTDVLSLNTFPINNTPDLQETLKSPDISHFKTSNKRTVSKKRKIPASKSPGQTFQLGENLGVTPGKVVFQNELFQLIQYEPLTAQVAKRPLFIVPPWSNKYYIFDLSPENSFIRWSLESGLTVFVMSWVNPTEQHTQKTMTDYVLHGVKIGLDQVCKISNEKKVNVVTYCTGGTLLGNLMGYLKTKKDTRIASATYLATPFDFSKIDEVGIYRYEGQQRKLEEYVKNKGYLEGHYMVQAFNLLRVNDLIWSSDVNYYLLGQDSFPFDMLYWTCDALRMPTKMHSTYLREILIENRLMKQNALLIEDVPIDLREISTPLFVVAAQEDNIAPWHSVYALTQMTKSSSKKFVLSSSGHVAGVFNHPKFQKYHYWTSEILPKEADDWFESTKIQKGSWWSEWRQWVDAYGGGLVSARLVSKDYILEEAPGSYATASSE